MTDGPFVEQEIWEHLSAQYPGQVQMLGPDVMPSGANGSNLENFKSVAGNLTFPLLRDCADGTFLSDTNLLVPYFERDNYVVINSKGIIRYHAADAWPYGNRYHRDEILGTVDSLVIHGLDAGGQRPPAWSLAAAPNPARGPLTLELANPTAAAVRARVTVLDVSGRRVAELPETLAGSGLTRVVWDCRGARGERLPAGLYLVRAELGPMRLLRPVVLTR